MKKKLLIGCGALVLACLLAAVLYIQTRPETAEGAKTIDVVVVHGDGTEAAFQYQTDAEYLGEVLVENELVEGTESAYGLFITTVDGETADDSLQQWWCITRSGEMLSTGADQTPIADGEQYELTLTEGY
ncbi:DUF4430 domain-containing protein [Dysosmobacter sp.]|uniref:DUF4430 domain-containing protein n=1 Tax=Dysosmobacter sp. TaxID=2591382 RepID=UPI002A9AEE42|nr:DUF4430 domain-containing protein [Dysosmobacter sp.]MCI6054242.1 DUF4430 domain-containing protein [Dysosmobacter sp.]MDY5508977.1 DUF4430 domain-containing protein [Dysosmobacter sp.]